MTIARIFQSIEIEMGRALGKHGESSMSGPAMSDAQRVVVLAEELGEVSRALLDGDRANLRTELVQLAAASCAWLSRMED